MAEHPTTDDGVVEHGSPTAGGSANIDIDVSEKASQPMSHVDGYNTLQEHEELRQDQHQDNSAALNTLAIEHWTQFQQGGGLRHLEEAISLHRQALRLRTNPHPDRFISLNNLAGALQTRFRHGGGLKYLEEAITLHRQALQLRPYPHADCATSSYNLAIALQAQFMYGSELIHLEEAIALHRQALQLRPDPNPDRSMSLNDLAISLQTRYQHSGGLDNLEEAISLHREALRLQPNLHPKRGSSLNNLAIALQAQFQQGGGLHHLEEAITLHRQALQLRSDSHPDRFTSISNLANALQIHFENGGGLKHLEEAITLHREALRLMPHPHPNYFILLNNLAVALQDQFKHGAGLNHLEEAISLHREALQLWPDQHSNRAIPISNLANALQALFEHSGELNHLEETITLHKQALQLRPGQHSDCSISLSSLASALQIQFLHGGGLNYLEEAIILHRQALQLRPDSHPDHSMSLNNLAGALQARFEHDGQLNHLEEAITLHRQALRLRPDPHPERSMSLNNLARALQTRFQHSGGLKYLEEAISLQSQALQLRPDSDPYHFSSLNNLATALQAQFQHCGELRYLHKAIELLEPKLQLLPEHDSLMVDPSTNHIRGLQLQQSHLDACQTLGAIYITAHKSSASPNVYLDQAMHAFSSVLCFPHSSPFLQFEAANTWAKYADEYHQPSAMQAYDLAIQLLPQTTSLGYSTRQWQQSLVTHGQSKTLASNASQYAIRMQCFDKAIEYLEAARAILWFQILQRRPPFDQLSTVAPELGNRLAQIARVLDFASHNDSVNTNNYISDVSQSLRKTDLTIEWKTKLDEVRKIPGFEEFLLPRRLSSLQKAAGDCPIAVLIPHDNGSYCLVMTSATIYHISIPSFTTQKLRGMATDIRNAALNTSRAQYSHEETTANNISVDAGEAPVDGNKDRLNATRAFGKAKPNDVFRLVLAELWKELVKPVIDILHIKKSSMNYRTTVQWCPTGVFTFLPIHAAGIYSSPPATHSATLDRADISENTANECASDYIVSSYTPTIGTLLSPELPLSPKEFKMLAVVAGSDLYHTKQELHSIRTRVPEDCLIEVGVNGIPAHVETIVSHLPSTSIVHFACHGVQERSNPLDSGLALEDGMLTIERIMAQPHPNGSLAFLCACETAMGDEKLPDEAMSMGESLIFSGFQRVIATMWRIMDRHGPTVADAFYEELFRGPDGNPMSVPEFNRSAQALDIAVQKLRSTGVPFHEWVPFIHLGKAT